MPAPDKPKYASKAQQRFFHAAVGRGEITKAAVNRRDQNTNFKKLAARVHKKK